LDGFTGAVGFVGLGFDRLLGGRPVDGMAVLPVRLRKL